MRKYLFMLPVLFFTAGCLQFSHDPAAEKAAAVSLELHKHLPSGRVALDDALKLAPAAKHPAIRGAFAQLLCASGRKDNLAMLKAEKARIELNVLLGFLPEDIIAYAPGGALDCPAEIPAVTAVEKAALICRPDAEPLEMLRKLRLTHLEAVYALNRHCPCTYVRHCIDLADIAGVDFNEIYDLSEYEKRFDDAMSRRQKEQKMAE